MTGHVRRRGERSWEIKFDLGPDPKTGKRLTRYHSFKGTKKEAEAELTRLKASADNGAYVDLTKMTVAEFSEKWLSGWAEPNVSPKTLERYADLLRGHVVPHVGTVLVQRLSPLNLTELYARLRKEGRGDGRGLAPRTVLHVHRVLHQALKHGVLWRILNSNPAASVDAPRVAATEITIIPSERVKTMLSALARRNEATAPVLHRLVTTALATGMRRGELLGLRWKDTDLEGASIRVEQALEQTRKGGLRFKEPKTKFGRRSISLPGFAVAALRAHWEAQQEARRAARLDAASRDALVFPGPDFEPRSPNALTKEWAAAADAVGVDVTFHALRHTHASQLIAAGLDVLTISRRLGHGSPAITLGVYGHLFPDTDGRAARALEAAYSSATDEEHPGGIPVAVHRRLRK